MLLQQVQGAPHSFGPAGELRASVISTPEAGSGQRGFFKLGFKVVSEKLGAEVDPSEGIEQRASRAKKLLWKY